MPAVVVAGRRLDRQVDETEGLVDRNLRPHAGVARVLGRPVEPGLVARLALLWDRVKDPEALAGAHVEPAHVAFIVLETPGRGAFAKRRADDDHVATHDRRALESDLAGREVGRDGLVDVGLEIDGPVRAEARDSRARLRVERDEAIARRDVEDSLLASVSPIREAAPGELSRRGRSALALVLPVNPFLSAGCGVERDDRAIRSAGRIQDAADHQRRPFELEFRPRPQRVRLESPRDLERAEVPGRDLLERGIACPPGIPGIARPFALAGRERRALAAAARLLRCGGTG